MSRQKAEQHSSYLGTSVSLPVSASATTSALEQTRRTWRGQPREDFLKAFDNTFENHVKEWINKNRKIASTGKVKLKAGRSLPRGFLVKVDAMANLEKGQSSDRFTNDNGLPLARTLWNQYLESKFDTILNDYQHSSTPSAIMSDLALTSPMIAGTPMSVSSSSNIGSPGSISSATSAREEKSLDYSKLFSALESIEDQEEEENYAVNTVRFRSLIRKDIPEELQKKFFKKMKNLITLTSDFTIDFQMVVFFTMSLFRNHTVMQDGEKIYLQAQQGFEMNSIFPSDFSMLKQLDYSSSPPPSTPNATVDLQIKHLFSEGHLQMLLSEYYGLKGMNTSSKEKYPLVANLLENSKLEVQEHLQFKKDSLPRPCYVVALTKHQVNLQNMWRDNKIFNALVDKLVLVLLRFHLSPRREEKRRDAIKSFKEKEKERGAALPRQKAESTSFRKSRCRNTFRVLNYRYNKCNKKKKKEDGKWARKAHKLKQRLDMLKASVNKSNVPPSSSKRKIEASSSNSSKKVLATSSPKKPGMPIRLPRTDSPASDNQYDSDEEELSPTEVGQDASSKRITNLKGFIKGLLFNDESITEQLIKRERPDLSRQEVIVTLLIATKLKPYIPMKENRFHIAYQLPFVILANDLLRCAGYEKFTRKICPIPTTRLNAFTIDAACLYTLFCQHGQDRLRFFHYNGQLFRSLPEVYNHKDAIFNPFFDVEKIQAACKRSNLKFSHNITILPGLKSQAKASKKTTASLSDKKKRKQNIPESKWNSILNQADKDKKKLRKEIDELQEKINALSEDLKTFYKAMKDGNFTAKIKLAKSFWKSPFGPQELNNDIKGSSDNSNDSNRQTESSAKGGIKIEANDAPDPSSVFPQKEIAIQGGLSSQPDLKGVEVIRKNIYNFINKLKDVRYKAHLDIQECRRELSHTKSEQYIRRKALYLPKKNQAIQARNVTKIERSDPKTAGFITHTGNASLVRDAAAISKDFIFSGTDYGIAKMSVSVPVTIESYKYHLSLYNRFSALATPTEEMEPDFQPLPNIVTVAAHDVHFGSREFNHREKLLEIKKKEQKVLDTEKKLSEQSLSQATNQDEIWKAYNCAQKSRETLRNFYQSPRMNAWSMRRENFKRKAKDRICLRERQSLNPAQKKVQNNDPKGKGRQMHETPKQLIMMIGDKGKGVGSTIKGHLRYGGNWKQDIHARHTTVCVTNEDYTSQTCIYCYEKLHHPKQKVKKKDKTINKTIKGTFICYNPKCSSERKGYATSSRDQMSALAIAISGITVLLFQEMLPPFKSNVSHFNTELNKKREPFCIGSGAKAGSSESPLG